MFTWLKRLFKIKEKPVLNVNDIVITADLAKAILLNKTILSDEMKTWGKKNFPRYADFFDPNQKNYSVPLYRQDDSVWQVRMESSKILIGHLIRFSDANQWIIRSVTRDTSAIWDTLKKMGIA